MSEQRVAQLLAEAAEDVPAPHLAEASWQRAGVVRHRRRIGAASVIAALALVVGIAVVAPGSEAPSGPSGPPTSPAPAVTGPLPTMLPRLDGSPLPARLDWSTAIPLSRAPMTRALALYQPLSEQDGAPPSGPIYALDVDGRLRLLDDVELSPTRDAGGNLATPLKSGSLSPDGRIAAFPQTDKLVLVNLLLPAIETIPVAGYNESVVWLGDGSLVVGRAQDASLVTLNTGRVRTLPLAAWDLVGETEATPDRYLELRARWDGGRAAAAEPARLRFWSGEGTSPARVVALGGSGGDAMMGDFYGRAWRSGDLVVRSGWLSPNNNAGGTAGPEAVVVVNLNDGVIVNLLDVGRERWKACCEALGWLNDHMVLLRIDRQGVVAWDIWTDVCWQVQEETRAVISLADLNRRG
ncbi:MAG TPA: hypothetical protein VF163_09855 [Micromonosporaceae bacterium]